MFNGVLYLIAYLTKSSGVVNCYLIVSSSGDLKNSKPYYIITSYTVRDDNSTKRYEPNKGELSYHVSIQKEYNNSLTHICDGAIVSTNLVLTSSSCNLHTPMLDNENRANYYAVADGVFIVNFNAKSINLSRQARARKIKKFCVRKSFVENQEFNSDGGISLTVPTITLVILQQDFYFKLALVGKVELAETKPDDFTECQVSFFKYITDEDDLHRRRFKYLLKSRVKIFSCGLTNDKTPPDGRKRDQSIFCSSFVPDVIDGSPVVCDDRLVGVAFIRKRRKVGFKATTYLSVSSLSDWVMSNLYEKDLSDAICIGSETGKEVEVL